MSLSGKIMTREKYSAIWCQGVITCMVYSLANKVRGQCGLTPKAKELLESAENTLIQLVEELEKTTGEPL